MSWLDDLKKKMFTFEINGLEGKDFDANRKINNAMDKGKTIVVNNPKSERINGNQFIGEHTLPITENSKYINSTAIEKWEYNPKTEDLDVTFAQGGGSYRFPSVPKDVVDGWGRAHSKGKYYHEYIKPYSINE